MLIYTNFVSDRINILDRMHIPGINTYPWSIAKESIVIDRIVEFRTALGTSLFLQTNKKNNMPKGMLYCSSRNTSALQEGCSNAVSP